MAVKNRKTRTPQIEVIRFRFDTAAQAKSVEERFTSRAGVEVERTGKTLSVPANGLKALEKASTAEGVLGTEIGQRGRPKAGETPQTRTVGVAKKSKAGAKGSKTENLTPPKKKKAPKILSGKKPGEVLDKLPAKDRIGSKVSKFVVLTPSPADAIKLAKKLGTKRNGARVIIREPGGSSDEIAKRAMTNAKKLGFPIVLEDGFGLKAKKLAISFAKKPKPAELAAGSTRRPKPKSVIKTGKAPKASAKKALGGNTKPVWILNIVSSNLKKAWYNVVNETLTLEFNSGKKYRYMDVDMEEFLAFTTADSQGSHFAEFIKGVKEFKAIKVTA